MKFAFILNTNGGHPDTYTLKYMAGENEYWIYGVTGVEEGIEFAKTLGVNGFDLVNLCGDFDEEMTAEIASSGIESHNAKYLPEELEKIELLTEDQLAEYGIIIVVENGEAASFDKKDEACNIYVRFVRTENEACQAALNIVEAGGAFIELCSWFDKEKTEGVIAAVNGMLPIGTCGNI